MSRYIAYQLEAKENIKLATTNMQIDAEDSMDYISGSAIRGAYIYKYIRAHRVKDINQGIHRKKLLAGGIKFLNAYPVYQDKRSLPLPKSYFAPKQDIKTFEDKIDIYLGLDRPLPPGYEKIRLSEFVHREENRYTRVRVEKVSNLHINKREEKNRLFRYESIRKNQVFSGLIKVEKDEYVDEILNLFSDEVVYIGGSKGSGYGRCLIKNMEVLDKNPEGIGYAIDENKDHIYIIALSDIIYRTDEGRYKTKIEEKLLEQSLGVDKAQYIDSSVDTNNISSFNNKWNARTPNLVAIKAGSVFKYKIEGPLDKFKMELFVDSGIGERRAEGFGRFAITTQIEDGEFYASGQVRDKVKRDISLTREEEDLINLIETRVYSMRVENKTNARVLQLDKQLRQTDRLKQWGTLKDFFLYLSRLDIEEGKKVYKNYMDHIVEKRGKSYKDMERVDYVTSDNERKSLIEFLNSYMEDISDRNKFEDIYGDCEINIVNNKNLLDKRLIYRANLKVLSELCRYQIRKEDV